MRAIYAHRGVLLETAAKMEWIGWISSFMLVITIAVQIHKQWHDETSQGVSLWLYLGQFGAEIGFIWYSWLVRNWVFVFTNSVLLIENVIGLAIVLRHRRRRRSSPTQPSPRSLPQ